MSEEQNGGQVQPGMIQHPLIQTTTAVTAKECTKILKRTTNIIGLLGYLEFSSEEITREAAEGLYYLHMMLKETVDYVNRALVQERNQANEKMKEVAQPRQPYHPLIWRATNRSIEDCQEILKRTTDVISLLRYLDFSNEEITREAAEGLQLINMMVKETIDYATTESLKI